jgi:hypothetical protein
MNCVLSREAVNTNFTVFGFDPNALDASTLTITLITDAVYISITYILKIENIKIASLY